jgi:hypothetical protein
MGGPLEIGDIEVLSPFITLSIQNLGSLTCIVCPWHYFKIDVKTGQSVSTAQGLKISKVHLDFVHHADQIVFIPENSFHMFILL